MVCVDDVVGVVAVLIDGGGGREVVDVVGAVVGDPCGGLDGGGGLDSRLEVADVVMAGAFLRCVGLAGSR